MKEKIKAKVLENTISIACLILSILLIPILISNLILIISGMINKDELPSVFGISPLAVETDSMAPLFSGGDLILIKKCEAKEINKNDIISYYEPTVSDHSVIVTHRVIEIQNNADSSKFFITQGDANNVKDGQPITESLIIGKYIASIKGLGNFIMFLSTTNGMLICVVLPVCLIFGLDYLKRIFGKNHKYNENELINK